MGLIWACRFQCEVTRVVRKRAVMSDAIARGGKLYDVPSFQVHNENARSLSNSWLHTETWKLLKNTPREDEVVVDLYSVPKSIFNNIAYSLLRFSPLFLFFRPVC